MSAKKLVAALVAFAGATAFTACLLALVDGMRDVAQTDGGFCASGGPYVIAHQCSSSDIRLIMIGIFGALIAAGFYAGGSAGLGSKAASAGLVLWAALFGTLGWNFVSIGHSGAPGMLFTGVLFLAMAVGGHHVPAGHAADARPGAGAGHGVPGSGPEHRNAADRRLAGRQRGGHGVRHRTQRIADQHAAMTG